MNMYHSFKLSLLIIFMVSPSLHAANVALNPNGKGNIIFQPTNQDIDILDISDSSVSWTYTLFMFDDAADLTHYDPNTAGFDALTDQSIMAIEPTPMQIEFNGLTASHNQTNDTLVLSGDTSFVFALWNHNFGGGTWIEATLATQKYAGIPDIYDIVFQFNNPNNGLEETVVFGVDLTPVPLPASVWLFMAGLCLLARLKQRSSAMP